MKDGLAKFKRFAMQVWDVDPSNKSDEEIAEEGLAKMEEWMNELGLVMHISEFGVNENQIDDIVKSTIILTDGYKVLNAEDLANILKASL